MKADRKREDILEIFGSGLRAADPEGMILEKLKLNGDLLSIDSGGDVLTEDLGDYDRIFVVGVGKASAKMALAVEKVLGERITGGVVAVKYGHTEDTRYVKLIEAGHPVPDENSLSAADEIISLCSGADERTLIINLVSGGGSALLCKPYSDVQLSLSLNDKQETTRLLLACGAEIKEINCIRKHLSQVKGGRLAGYMAPARSLNLILSDVVGDRLDSIASGITVPDETDFAEAAGIIKKYGLGDSLPETVRLIMERGLSGEIEDTPSAGSPAFERTSNILIGTNHQALAAAGKKASSLGYNTVILSSQITGEAREAAKFYMGIAADLVGHQSLASLPACLIAGGETTVTLRGGGMGGRNQEMALAFLSELKGHSELADHVVFLSGATDGNDGPTDAAGGFADSEILRGCIGVDLQAGIDDSDSYHVLERIGALLKTGPTNTNVCDIQIIIAV